MPATLSVLVLQSDNSTIPDATVRLGPAGNGTEPVEVPFDPESERYRATVEPGRYLVSVERLDFAPDRREVTVGAEGAEAVFVLAEPGLPHFQRGPVKVPFRPQSDLVGVTFRPTVPADTTDAAVEAMVESFADLGLAEVPVPEHVRAQHTHVLRVPAGPEDAGGGLETLVAQLQARPDVDRAGPVVVLTDSTVSYLTDELVVRFAEAVTEQRARELLEGAGLEVLRPIPYAGNSYHVRRPGPASYALLDTAAELAELPEVEYAEPNLASAYELDAVTPGDFLWNGLWDRHLIGLPQAWQELQDAGVPAFGAPNIIIADVDQGVVSVGGVPSHPEFQGTVSDGSTKVYRLFDFRTLVPHNDVPMGDHGMGTAGVAAARANNPSTVPGVTEGLSGAAPNCRVMGLIFPSTEVDIADMYIWAAGFNPNSPRAGFPAPISPGADIFTTSIGFGAGAPLSGTAKAMLDHLTTYGRGGKGCLCFFSAGNGNANVATVRPYASYERSFGTAATTLANDGVTEIRAPYSGFGTVELSAPSHDQYVGGGSLHNPPQNFAPWSCALPGQGNLLGAPTSATTLSAAVASGAANLTVASIAGLANGDVLLIGDPGAAGGEPVRITGVPSVGTVPVTALLNAHPAGTTVRRGVGNYRNDFGGTSSATPLAAGTAALVLSAEPDLTWVEAREIIRQTSVKFDLANTDPVGRWLDRSGTPITVSGQPPYFSQWYGHGRIDGAAAVLGAVDYTFARDLVVRDNLADAGNPPTPGPFWNTPDLWVRDADPAVEGAAALPANYATAGPHVPPRAGQDNWVYVRVRNNGTQPSYDAYVRVYLAHWPGLEFVYPTSFIPTNRPGQPVPAPLTPGTYLIGEAKVSDLAAGADTIVNLRWPAALVPPETVVVGGTPVHWHPCLLVEVSPHDGPAATGGHVWDSNNLAQKNITIIYTDAGKRFGAGIVLGDLFSRAKLMFLEVDRGRLPKHVRLHVDLVDPKRFKWLREYLERARPRLPVGRGAVRPVPAAVGAPGVLPLEEAESTDNGIVHLGRSLNFKLGRVNGREAILLGSRGKVLIPFGRADGPIGPIVIGGELPDGVDKGTWEITLIQRDQHGAPTGAAGIQLHVGEQR
jgi:hypothetical protein